MKHNIFFIIVLFVSKISISAQSTNWVWQNPLPQGNTLYAVDYINPQVAIAVGDYGTIIRTTNSSNDWIILSSNTTVPLYAVSFSTKNIGIAVGGDGIILRTDNRGATWINQPSSTSCTFRGAEFVNYNLGVMFDNFGTT